jgi:cation diffusion facilitator CzcD-associated flavoprotein CzcO
MACSTRWQPNRVCMAGDDMGTNRGMARIAIVGSGFSGIGLGVRLRQAGIHDFVILERADDLGGTWRDNTYPGCGCDVPSHLYSFSFAPNPRWSRTFSPQDEIWDYLRRCADEYGVAPHIRFDHELLEARWDDHAQRWELETEGGTIDAQILVSAVGALSEPRLPDIPGVEDFEGASFHSAAWDHDHDLTGERVAVVGTGASSIQFVPKIQPRVARLHVFQRTPPWIVPQRDRPLTRLERRLYGRLPAAQLLMRAAIYWARETFLAGFMYPDRGPKLNERIARRHLEQQVPDPELRAKLTPDYRMGCKRILISDDYYPALTRPNVELVTDPIREFRSGSVVTADGAERDVDTVIFGTGFHVIDLPVAERIRGRDGATLADLWQGSPQAHRGTTVAGYPNLFMLVGPNTGLAHNSIVFMIESQIAYLMDCLRFMDRHGVSAVEVRREAQEAFNRDVQERMEGTVWTTGGCKSWYLDAQGRNTALWPGLTWRFRRATRRFQPAEYVLSQPPADSGVSASEWSGRLQRSP